ncbi:hypothetical protein [Rugamonas violacea]|uniref:hypothetical protein n=1 Tax=Rugamonas sp. CCM 8940 TaxID=2765359 RepID=UPI00366D08C0
MILPLAMENLGGSAATMAVAQGVAQARFDAHALLHALVHVLAVEGDMVAVGVAAALLGAVHGDVGQPQQGFGVAAVCG